jgi:hypothetical protein
VVLSATSESVDVQLTVHGFRDEDLEGVRGEREVRLRPALAARLVLAESVELPAPPLHLKATLVAEGAFGPDFGVAAFDETREIRCFAPGVGRMKVQWILERRAGDSASASTIEVEPPLYVDVRDEEGEQRFVLEPTSESIAQAIARKN